MKSGPPLPSPRYAALLQVLRTAESLWEASRVYFAQWDLSPAQFNVLNVLRSFPEGCSQMDLSRQLVTHRSNVTGLVDRLERRGLVRRRDVPGDRRAYAVQLTAAGQKLLQEILPLYHAKAERVWEGIPAGRIPVLLKDLETLGRNALDVAEDPS